MSKDDEPNELEMSRTRSILASSQTAYLEAVATHHARVAQIASDMYKLAKVTDYTPKPTPDHIECMEQMAKIIERSFAEAFGVRLRPVLDNPPDTANDTANRG